MLANFHTHTAFCDGKNTPEEIVNYAIARGFDSIGFSSHAITEFNIDCELRDVNGYICEINSLKEKYAGKIDIFLGAEFDYYSVGLMPEGCYDYKIGSVHFARMGGDEYLDFDYKPEIIREQVNKFFGGNSIAYAKKYYETLADMPNRVKADFVGHFDLLTKFIEKNPTLIDVEAREYKNAALEALIAVREKMEFFEVNTGAMSRGHRTTPYPAPFILDEMKIRKCKLILTSDCHNMTYLDYHFDEAKEYLKSHGFGSLWYLTKTGFVERPI